MTRAGYLAAALAVASAHAVNAAPLFRAPQLRARNVRALDVWHIDQSVSTLIAIAPGRVEGFPGAYHRHVTAPAAIAAALGAVETLVPEPDAHGAELRWKLTFRDFAGRPALELWHHGREPYGRIGTTDVKFGHDRLLAFLHAHYDRSA